MNLSDRVILVVDDDPDICWALNHLLGALGAKCIRAVNGQNALDAAKLNRPTLALLDAKLPDISGLELAERIRDASPGIVILVISGYFYKDDPAIRAALVRGLVDGFIEKPFSHMEIIEAVNRAFCFQDAALPAMQLSAVH